MLSLFLIVSVASAFTPGTTLASRPAVSSTDVMMGPFDKFTKASPTKPTVTKNAKPLSPGSNYPSTKNIQTQSNGFGTFLQKFEVASSTKQEVEVRRPHQWQRESGLPRGGAQGNGSDQEEEHRGD